MKVFVFKGDDIYALTDDRDGTSLPETQGPWTFERELELEQGSGSHEALDPEIALDAINDRGYYLSNVEITTE